jgi:hypothetical protein
MSEGLLRHDLEAKIVKHSWQDEGFRKEFLADPAGVFVKYLNVPAEALPKVVVHQEQPGSWHIVLLAKQVNAPELSEVDLERVAGGTIHTPEIKVTAATVVMITTAMSIVGIQDKTAETGW